MYLPIYNRLDRMQCAFLNTQYNVNNVYTTHNILIENLIFSAGQKLICNIKVHTHINGYCISIGVRCLAWYVEDGILCLVATLRVAVCTNKRSNYMCGVYKIRII